MATSNTDYEFTEIEKYWQNKWDCDKTFKAQDFAESKSGKYYILDMFPYPSGAGLHIGHPEGYTASDIIARYKWAKGFNVMHPMGWDAFGLPAEQYALKTGTHPAVTTHANIDNFKKQIKSIGFAIDWDREINTTDPDYFKWTQWIFLRLFKMGLAYVDEKPVWWCPALGTVLANEEVVDGKSEVGKHSVEKRKLRQWVLKITAYADRLLKGLEKLDWPDSTKRLQTNWIGRSEGAEVDFEIADSGAKGEKLRVFTTRPDTLYGATYMVIAPEHPLIDKLTSDEMRSKVEAYKKEVASKSDLDRTDLARQKTGVFTGAHAINPLTGKKIPIWTADYVLMSYGTGAIMAVPAHDERDYEFAVKFDLPIIRVIEKKNPDGSDAELPFAGAGKLINSGDMDGVNSAEAVGKITAFLESRSLGKKAVNYKLRDWLFSRQRYWGEPFPIIWTQKDGYEAAAKSQIWSANMPKDAVSYVDDSGRRLYALALPDSALPLRLPEIKTYQPSGTGESPLAHATDWLNVKFNAKTGEIVPASENVSGADWFEARRETNTMPQWAGSCWYYLRYCDPHNASAPISAELEKYWQYPDFYIGGAEHAVLHLLYARFWHKVLYDCGVVTNDEPFKKLFHQGIILGQLEYTGYKKDGHWVSADADHEGAEAVKLDESEVEKAGANFVLKSDKSVKVDARSFKMSKSRGNVVNPDDVIRAYGADSLRLYEMFLGPLEDQKPWNTNGIEGVSRFIKKVWREYVGRDGKISAKISAGAKDSPEFLKVLNETISKVGADIENLRFNTAISQMMICVSSMQKQVEISLESAKKFIQLLAPFAPHVCEEIWDRLGCKGSVSKALWPEVDTSKVLSDSVKMAVQVNGKLRGEVSVPAEAAQEEILDSARKAVSGYLEGKTLVRQICVPGKIVNFVIR